MSGKYKLDKEEFGAPKSAMVVDRNIFTPKVVTLTGRVELAKYNWRLIDDQGEFHVVDTFEFNQAAYNEMVEIRRNLMELCERWREIRSSLVKINCNPDS